MATEKWVVIKPDGFYLHVENDGPAVLRRGSEPREEKISLYDLSHKHSRKVTDDLEQELISKYFQKKV